MFLSRMLTNATRTFRAASSEGMYDLMDSKTGRLLSGAVVSDTGQPMSAEIANSYHAWFRAMTLIAYKAASVPREMFRTEERGPKMVKPNDVTRAINVQANSEQTAFQFWLQMTGHVGSRGNGFAAIYRESRSQEVAELIPLDPDRTYPVRKDGGIWYVCYPFGEKGQGYRLAAEDVLHFKGAGFDGLIGYPVWKVAGNEIALARAQRKLEGTLYKNSGRPSMIFETDMRLTDKAKNRIRDDWERLQVGIDNAGKTAILDGGLKSKAVSLSPGDLGQSPAAQMSITAISNYTGVPVSKLGGQKLYSSQELDDRAFVSDCLEAYFNLQDDECGAKFISVEDRSEGMFIRSDRESLMRPDLKAKFEMIRIATGGKPFWTQNEGRAVLDYPPMEDEEGADELGMPLNMGQGGFANEKKDPNDQDPGRGKDRESDSKQTAARKRKDKNVNDVERARATREAARYALAHTTARMIKRVGAQAETNLKKGVQKFSEWVESGLSHANAQVFRSEFSVSERFISATLADGVSLDGKVSEFVMSEIRGKWLASPRTLIGLNIASEVQSQLVSIPDAVCAKFIPEAK